jgi:hypothetical protein
MFLGSGVGDVRCKYVGWLFPSDPIMLLEEGDIR